MDEPCILLIEDDPDGAELLRQALRGFPSELRVMHFRDGPDAVAWLTGAEATTVGAPSVALLEPHRSGAAGLTPISALRALPRTQLLPIVVLSATADPALVAAAYRHGANSVVRKPFDPIDFRTAIQQVATYWLLRNACTDRSED